VRPHGERAGNIANVITLPRFNTFNLAAGYTWSRALIVRAQRETTPSTARRDDLARLGVNPAIARATRRCRQPAATRCSNTCTVQPRAFYLTATYRF